MQFEEERREGEIGVGALELVVRVRTERSDLADWVGQDATDRGQAAKSTPIGEDSVPWIDDGAVVIQIGGVRGASGYRVAERDDRAGARGDGGVDDSSMGFSRVYISRDKLSQIKIV